MASLQLTAGSVHSEPKGSVTFDGGCVKLLDAKGKMVFGYKLRDGETIRRGEKEDEYIVEL